MRFDEFSNYFNEVMKTGLRNGDAFGKLSLDFNLNLPLNIKRIINKLTMQPTINTNN